MTTKVIFRRFGGETIALFPEEVGSYRLSDCASYARIGQHSEADPQYVIAHSKPATAAEYAELKAELEAIGYRLDERQRYTRQMFEERRRRLASL